MLSPMTLETGNKRSSFDSDDNISPSDLHYSSSELPPHAGIMLRNSLSSPVQSDLPNIYSHLRANDTDIPSKFSHTKNILKKLLRINKSSDNIADQTSGFITGTNGTIPTSTSTSLKRGKSIQRSSVLQHTDSDLEYFGDQVELQPEISKCIGNIKIAPILSKEGLPLLKVSHKSKKRILFSIDPTSFKFTWRVTTNGSGSSNSPTTPALNSASTTSSSTSNGERASGGHRLSISSVRSPHEFYLDDIKYVYKQKQGSAYREELHISKEFENKWITIIYFNQKKGNLKSLHLIADTEHDYKKLNAAVQNLRNLRYQLAKEFLIDLNSLDESYMKMLLSDDHNQQQQQPNKHIREFLSFNDILKYAKRLNINVNTRLLQLIFDQVVENGGDQTFERGLNFEQFKKFVSILKERKDILRIFEEISRGKQFMDCDDVRRFLKDTQKEDFDDKTIQEIFEKFSNSDKVWGVESLNRYLLSSNSKTYRDIDSKHYYDHPLNDYYISSSHNTYLTGRQVVGDSSVEGYIRALQRGCRCVEIDIWNGSDNEDSSESEPVVNHGRTFTKAIGLANVIRSIKKFAFITSPYPLILSLEIHCSPLSQLKVVAILVSILKDDLILAAIDDTCTLPSPNELKHKIIVKVKKTTSFQNLVEMDNGSYTTSTTTTNTSTTTTTTPSTSQSEDNGTSSSKNSTSLIVRRKNKAPKVVNELSELGVYCQGVKFRNFSLPESKTYNHCFSLGEKLINRMIKDSDKKISLDKHNRRYLMRVYPAGTRLKSSNFNPIPYWNLGVQMVATNWQTYDLGQQLNESMFNHNQLGYVLKSNYLRKPILKSSKILKFIKPIAKKLNFTIDIISGHQLPKVDESAISPYVTFEIFGAEKIQWDDRNQEEMEPCSTRIIIENGYNPIFNTRFSGNITVNNNLVFVKFVIYAATPGEQTPIGVSVCKMDSLKQGFRYIPIYDLFGEQLLYSSLFVKINYDEDVLLNM